MCALIHAGLDVYFQFLEILLKIDDVPVEFREVGRRKGKLPVKTRRYNGKKNLDQIKGPVQYDAMNQEANTMTPRF